MLLEEATVVELLDEAHKRVTEQAKRPNSSARREYEIVLTSIEDAAMRYTRGRAIHLGRFAPADLDRED